MKSETHKSNDLNEDLVQSYASFCTGTYAQRYDKILEFAFQQSRQILPATRLRALAGGGSFTTAQDAVDRFRAQLFDIVSKRLEFGPEIPPEIAEKASSVISNIWVLAKSTATAAFEEEKEQFRQREMQALEQASLESEHARQAQAELEQARTSISDLSQVVAAREEALNEAHARQSETQSRLDVLDAQVRSLQQIVNEFPDVLKRQTEAAQQERQELSASLKEAADASRRDLMLQMDANRTRYEQEAARLKAEIGKLSANLAEAASKMTELSANLAQTKSDLSAKQLELHQARTEAAQAQAALERELQRAQETEKRLLSEINAAREQFRITPTIDQSRLDEIAKAVAEIRGDMIKGKI